MDDMIGAFRLDTTVLGDAFDLVQQLPDNSIDIVVTSPPYWGQRMSKGIGVEEDPRDYIDILSRLFRAMLPKLKEKGIFWLNMGDSYNTPVNWREDDWKFSSLGIDEAGLSPNNSAYTKPRAKRKAFIDKDVPWLTYGNLLATPWRLIIDLCNYGWLYRGEVIWEKSNPMPEGRCRRPHRAHEPIYLLAKSEQHEFRVKPPVKSIWQFPNEHQKGEKHFSRFPLNLPKMCIEAYGNTGTDIVVFDPFAGSGTTGIAAINLGCRFIGFEIDPAQWKASNARLAYAVKIKDSSPADFSSVIPNFFESNN